MAGLSLLEALSFKGNFEGLWHRKVGEYGVEDLELAAVYDVDASKVGKPLSKLSEALKGFGEIKVKAGLHLDEPTPGLSMAENLRSMEEIAEEWQSLKVDVAVNLITSGGFHSSQAYAEAALKAGVCFLNATPTKIASTPSMVEAFRRAELTLAGDDLMSQLGGTALHRGLIRFLSKRGLTVVKSYELDVGGGLDTLATIRTSVKEAKRSLIGEALKAELAYAFPTMAGTTDYVDFLGKRRVSYIYMEGKGALGSSFRLDVTLQSVDPPNAVNILLDVIRALQVAKERGEYGAPPEVCAYGFKLPPKPLPLEEAEAVFTGKYVEETG
jgi:myo-inositol-1-phosphate synthase